MCEHVEPNHDGSHTALIRIKKYFSKRHLNKELHLIYIYIEVKNKKKSKSSNCSKFYFGEISKMRELGPFWLIGHKSLILWKIHDLL